MALMTNKTFKVTLVDFDGNKTIVMVKAYHELAATKFARAKFPAGMFKVAHAELRG